MIITVSNAPHGVGVIKRLQDAFPGSILIDSGIACSEEIDSLPEDKTIIFTKFDQAPDYVKHYVLNRR